jgi:hypothetical protein
MTAPDPLWHPAGAAMFDVGAVAQRDHEDIRDRIAVVLDVLLQATAGGCTGGTCKVCVALHASVHACMRRLLGSTCKACCALHAIMHGCMHAMHLKESLHAACVEKCRECKAFPRSNAGAFELCARFVCMLCKLWV